MSVAKQQLPDGWELAKVDDFARTGTGGTPSRKRSEYYGGNIPWVKSGDLKDGFVEHVSETISDEGLKNSNAKLFPRGSVCIALYGATVGRLGILDIKATTNQAVCGIFPDGDIESKYIFYALRNERENLISQAQGGAQPNISNGIIKKTVLRLAPLAEQRRIVEKIEALQERSRSVRETLAEVGPLLEQFRQSLLAAAFRGDLTADWRAANPNVEPATELLARIRQQRREKWEQTELAKYEAKGKQPPKGWQDKYKTPEPVDDSELPEIPDGWCWVTIGELSEPNGVFDGARDHGKNTPVELNLRTADYTDSGVRVIRLENLDHLEFDDTKITFISNEKFVGLKQRGIEEGDILIGSFVADSMRLSLPPESIVGKAVCKADVFTLRVIEDLIVP